MKTQKQIVLTAALSLSLAVCGTFAALGQSADVEDIGLRTDKQMDTLNDPAELAPGKTGAMAKQDALSKDALLGCDAL